jgi:hypothetical protein
MIPFQERGDLNQGHLVGVYSRLQLVHSDGLSANHLHHWRQRL